MLFGNINGTGHIKVMAFCMIFVRKEKPIKRLCLFSLNIKGPIVCKTNFTNVLPVTELYRENSILHSFCLLYLSQDVC